MRTPIEANTAVVRAVEILRLLEEQGPLVRDAIARATGIPRTTCLRILAALKVARVIDDDRHDGTWHLREQLAPATGDAAAFLAATGELVAAAAASGGHAVELYRREGGRLRLVLKRPAAQAGTNTLVDVGWVHDALHADARTALLVGAGLLALRRPLPAHDGTAMDRETLALWGRRILAEGYGHDGGFNRNGILRHLVPLVEGDRLTGALVAAQFMCPDMPAADPSLGRFLAGLPRLAVGGCGDSRHRR